MSLIKEELTSIPGTPFICQKYVSVFHVEKRFNFAFLSYRRPDIDSERTLLCSDSSPLIRNRRDASRFANWRLKICQKIKPH